jgi:hypothetical protein
MATLQFVESDYGIVDAGNAFICQQSMYDEFNRRVQFGWISVGGAGWDGAQSLPRTIELSETAQKLTFNAHPAVWTLHGARADVTSTVVRAGAPAIDLSSMIAGLGGSNGVQLHLRLEVTIPLISKEAITVAINVLGGHGHGGSTVQLSASSTVRSSFKTINSCCSRSGIGSIPLLLDLL